MPYEKNCLKNYHPGWYKLPFWMVQTTIQDGTNYHPGWYKLPSKGTIQDGERRI
jgi:hypothetical protein